jgi:hypothetical protein
LVVHQRLELLNSAGKSIEQAKGHGVKRTSILGGQKKRGQQRCDSEQWVKLTHCSDSPAEM